MAIVLLAAACSLPGSTDSAAPDATTSTTTGEVAEVVEMGEFAIVGRTIVDPFDNVFVPHGANVGAIVVDRAGQPVWLFSLGGNDITDPTTVAAVQAWNWNTLRVNARCTEIAANEFNAAWGNEEMLDAIDRVVDAYTPLGIVVVISCHDLTGQSPEIGSPAYREVEQFWTSAADRYGDNTYVWFNHLNEFHAPAEASTDDDNDVYWQSVVDDAYANLAATGAPNLLVFDLPNYGNDLGLFRSPEFRDWAATKCNTIWSWHAYGGLAPESVVGYDFAQPDEVAFRDEVANLIAQVSDADLPLMAGEFGYDWNAERQSTNFVWASERLGALTALDVLPPAGYGLLAWHANGDSAQAMTYGLKAADELTFAQPEPGLQLSELGERFWNLSQIQPVAGPASTPGVDTCQR
ncbi:MAG: cellulase family glycosylhydrolase [Acidimicrobiales bacterium]